jgi:hypothetical protein
VHTRALHNYLKGNHQEAKLIGHKLLELNNGKCRSPKNQERSLVLPHRPESSKTVSEESARQLQKTTWKNSKTSEKEEKSSSNTSLDDDTLHEKSLSNASLARTSNAFIYSNH